MSLMPSFDLVAIKAVQSIKRFLGLVRLPALIVGTILTANLALRFPGFWSYLAVAVYLWLWINEIRIFLQSKTYGTVIGEDGRPLGQTLVRATDSQGHLKATTVSGDDGRFVFNLNRGSYVFHGQRLGYHSVKTHGLKILQAQDMAKIRLELKKL